ncbi:MAG: universal stress protein [Methanoregula sp.]|nr:universal stress protein [Methanoregula sp.]
MFEKVLVAMDFSAHSQIILDCICEIPGVKEVVLLHVVDATAPSWHGLAANPASRKHHVYGCEKDKETGSCPAERAEKQKPLRLSGIG